MFTILITQHANMMKVLIALSVLVVLSQAQRPSFASSGPIGRPGLANRFKDDSAPSSSTISVVNRVGEDGSTPKIPVDARGDVDLVNTLNTWEREHQPFWLLNADHIERARNTTRGTTQTPNRNQISTQSGQGSRRPDANQNSLSNRNGGIDNTSSFDNRKDASASNKNLLLGRPSQGDIRPVHESSDAPMYDHRIHQGQRPTQGSQRKLRFHYERNNFH